MEDNIIQLKNKLSLKISDVKLNKRNRKKNGYSIRSFY